MTRYIRKSYVVEAVQFTRSNVKELEEFAGMDFDWDSCVPWGCDEWCQDSSASVLVRPSRWKELYEGDWVVKFEDGFDIVSNEDFVKDYVGMGARIE